LLINATALKLITAKHYIGHMIEMVWLMTQLMTTWKHEELEDEYITYGRKKFGAGLGRKPISLVTVSLQTCRSLFT
jgi:hypothetical protein